jgi:proteasome activator subunit 4
MTFLMDLQLLRYKGDLLSLLQLLKDKTFSKRGYAWSGKLLSSMLLTLSHTYPLENRFVNPEEWNSEGLYRILPSSSRGPHC